MEILSHILDTPEGQMISSSRIPSAFVLVGTPADFGDVLPYRLSTRMVVRRATNPEIKRIKSYLAGLSGVFPCSLVFEADFSAERTTTPDGEIDIVHQRPTLLPIDRQRYHVVSIARYCGDPFEQNYPDLIQLRVSSQLSTCPLFLNSATLRQMHHSLDFSEDWHRYTNPTDEDHVACKFDRNHLDDWRQVFAQVEKVRMNFPPIWHSLKLFSEVPVIKGRNELTVLALFAVLESLLTHNPKGESDSITHQIGSKILLISKRMDIGFDYPLFGNASFEKIWKKLYELRSRIAHGSSITFTGPLQVLDDVYTVERFMFSALRAVLRFAVQEPQLVLDLKSV
jgi:hypothetical protein